MNTNKINVLYLIQKTKINRRRKCPLKCRITYNKQRKDFATGVFVEIDHWNSNKQKLLNTDDCAIVNAKLSLISQKINEAFLLLQFQKKDFDVFDIYSQFKGENIKTEKTLLELYDLHNEATKPLIDIDFNKVSWSRYVENKRKVAEFIKFKYKKEDIKLNELELKFIKDLEYYFKVKKELSQATINRGLQRLKKVISYGIAEGYLTRNPFILHKPTKYKIKLVYLTEEELKILEEFSFKQIRLEQIRDLFIFCCYTGLAYQEMSTLSKEHLKNGFDGNRWIEMYRKKTDAKISIPLLPKADSILLKYNDKLPKISNQKFNSYLKEISEIVGIDKKLTHHNGRKTFATTVLLNNGVPMEVVSELLGHSRIQVTQEHYAKVVKSRVSSEILKLQKRLGQD